MISALGTRPMMLTQDAANQKLHPAIVDGVQRALSSVDDQSVHAVLHPVGVDVCLAVIVDGGNSLIPAVQREPGHDGLHDAYAALGVGHLITG